MDIQFDENDIANAINKLKKNSAAGPDGVPAILLINTKDAIKKPLQIILRKSIDEGVVPNIFKLAYIPYVSAITPSFWTKKWLSKL